MRAGFTIAMLLGAILVEAVPAVAAEPQAAAAERRLVQDWLGQRLQADFRAHGRKDAPWADGLAKFHEAFAAAVDGEFVDAPAVAKLDALAAELTTAGCDDPVFLLCRARIDIAAGRQEEAWLGLRRHLGAVQKAGYPPLYNVLGRRWFGLIRHPRVQPGVVDNGLVDATLALAADPAFAGPASGVYARLFMPLLPAFTAAAADRFAKPGSGVDPWITALAVGRREIQKAWEARGEGFAAQVAPEGWKGFKEHLAAAREQLAKAHDMHPEFPEAATEMITVCMGDGSGEEQAWFERAVAAQFGYLPAYERMLRGPLLPRWGGSHEAILALGRRCLDSGRFETVVPSIFVEAVLVVGAEMERRRDAIALPGVHADWVRACQGYIEKASLPGRVRIWKSRLAVGHWAAGEYEAACKVLDELEDDIESRVAEEVQAAVAEIVGESRLYGGRHAEAFREIGRLTAADEPEKAVVALAALAAMNDLPAAGRRIVEDRLAGLKRSAALASHDWIDLQPKGDLSGWQVVTGDWQVEPDGALLGTSRGPGKLKIVCQSDFGQDVEFTAWVDLCDWRDAERRWERLAVTIGHSNDADVPNSGFSARLARAHMELRLQQGYAGGGDAVTRAPLKSKNRLRVVVWDGKASVWVNGVKPVDKWEIPEDWLAGGRLAIGDFTDGRPLQVRVRSMRARRLDKEPDDF